MAKKAPNIMTPELEARQKEIDEQIMKDYPLYFLEMNRGQRQFIRIKNPSGKTPKRRLYEQGNKAGKCMCYDSLIDTTKGKVPIGKLYDAGASFYVYAWDGKNKVVAKASPPFKKAGLHQCYRISFSDGTFLDAADYHRVLSDKGWLFVEYLHAFFQDQKASIQEPCLSILPSGVLNLSGIPLNFLEDCFEGCRQYDGQPLMGQDISPIFLPSRDDVRQRFPSWSHEDDSDNKCTSIARLGSSLLSNWYDRYRCVAQYVGYTIEGFCKLFQQSPCIYPRLLRLSTAGVCQLQSYVGYDEYLHPSNSAVSSLKPSCELSNKIISCNPIGSQEVYDFEVETYHNYFANGLVHHNTEIGIAEDIAHAMGFRCWLAEDDPDFKVDIKVPNDGLIGCETMMHSVPEKIEPTLKRLIPKICKPVFKPGPTGVCIRVTLPFDSNGKKCGSVIHIRSYDQRPDTFEGIDFAWIHWDEPPPKPILQAAERGKIVTNAPSWFTMTPLKEPHIYDSFSLKAFTHGGDDPEIAVIRGPIWDNCRDFCRPCNLVIPENAEVRTLKRCPKCRKVMGFIPKAGIDEYLKTLPAEEREAREEGKWHHLSGLVYKDIDREKHVYEDFTVPNNWMKIEAVDPHDARPVHWLFGAVSPEEIEINGKKRHRIYWYDYLLAKGDLDEVVRQVKAKRALHGYETPYFVVLDKKFGEKTQMEEKSWQSELERRGITRMRLSHSSPGDVELGHKLVREYLKPQFSTLLGTAKPGMLWAKHACTGSNSPFHAMCNYQYKENKDKPEEEYKDWCDCTRYAAMEQPVYKAPVEEKKVIDLIMQRNQNSMKSRRVYVGAGH